MENDKAALRGRLRAQRRALSPQSQQQAARALCANVARMRYYRLSRRVACYIANDGEIDTAPILARLWREGKTPYLPVLARQRNERLWFAPVTPDTELAPNRFGIPEPRLPPAALARAQALDLILLPLVAFDARGHRVGMGGGFYDRSLEFLRHRARWRKPRLVGVAHDFQRVERIDTDSWDIPLDAVVTDRACYPVSD